MDRLQKKCFVASTGFHLLLVVILVVGPAFIVSKSKPDDMPPLTFIPVMTTDANVQGGGDPRGAAPPPPPAPTPAPPVVKPQPPPPVETHPPAEEIDAHEERKPDAPKEIIKPVDKTPDPEAFEPAKETRRRKPEISTTPISKPKDTDADKKAREESRREQERADAAERDYARRYADARRSALNALGNAANSVQAGKAGSTEIKLLGPGGGGVPYANFLQALKTIYEREWTLPDGITDNDAVVAASVTIARDGTVVSSRILRSSGNVAVDQSVRVTLRRVTFAVPLPPDAKEAERTVTIDFSVATKRGTG